MTDPSTEFPWIMREAEEGLLFLHWPMPVDRLQRLVPTGLTLDTYDGQAWLTLNAFNMAVAQFRDLPPLPGLNTSPEVDLRTYVRLGDEQGLLFLSMDIDNQLGVWISRALYHLPYLQSDVEFGFLGDGFRFESHRRATKAAPAAEFVATYGPAGAPFCAEPGSLEAFLLERHTFFVASPEGELHRGRDHRLPLVALPAEAEIEVNTIVQAAGLEVPDTAPILHYSPGLTLLTEGVNRIDGQRLSASTQKAVVSSSEP